MPAPHGDCEPAAHLSPTRGTPRPCRRRQTRWRSRSPDERGAGGAMHPGTARRLRAHGAPIPHQRGLPGHHDQRGLPDHHDGENQDEEDAAAASYPDGDGGHRTLARLLSVAASPLRPLPLYPSQSSVCFSVVIWMENCSPCPSPTPSNSVPDPDLCCLL